MSRTLDEKALFAVLDEYDVETERAKRLWRSAHTSERDRVAFENWCSSIRTALQTMTVVGRYTCDAALDTLCGLLVVHRQVPPGI